jgi:hypothetical protein
MVMKEPPATHKRSGVTLFTRWLSGRQVAEATSTLVARGQPHANFASARKGEGHAHDF